MAKNADADVTSCPECLMLGGETETERPEEEEIPNRSLVGMKQEDVDIDFEEGNLDDMALEGQGESQDPTTSDAHEETPYVLDHDHPITTQDQDQVTQKRQREPAFAQDVYDTEESTSQWTSGEGRALRRRRGWNELVRSQSAEQNYNLVEQLIGDGSALTTIKRYSYREVHLN